MTCLSSASYKMARIPARRITELSNCITENLDEEDPDGMVKLLRQCDAQLFAGFQSYNSVCDASTLDAICGVAGQVAKLLQENKSKQKNNLIVFSGCGTSGRIAWLAAVSFNLLLGSLGERPCFAYLISGGDQSLVISNELPEDDPRQGAKDLENLTKDATSVVFVGITCGLSAPYVAGQVDYAMRQPNFVTCLLGFNPVELSRDARIAKWDKTCKEVFSQLDELRGSRPAAVFILNPVVGPEAVSGSSRMKGGSMTKILLDTVSLLGVSQGLGIPLNALLEGTTSKQNDALPGVCWSDALKVLSLYQNTMLHLYSGSHVKGAAELITLAGRALCSPQGHLYLLGRGSFGIMGIIDVSEMVDTYGAELTEVKAFVHDGWSACGTTSGDLTDKGPLFHVSVDDFVKEVLPSLSSQDMILVTTASTDPLARGVTDKILSSPAKCALLKVKCSGSSEPCKTNSTDEERWSAVVELDLPHHSVCRNVSLFADFAVKLLLNAVTTCANVLKGRVFGNTMINLTLANSKLFQRSVEIVQKVTGAKKSLAEDCLKLSISRSDMSRTWSLSLEDLIRIATETKMVVPMAILLAVRSTRVLEATVSTWQGVWQAGDPSGTLKDAMTFATHRIEPLLRGHKVTMKSLMTT